MALKSKLRDEIIDEIGVKRRKLVEIERRKDAVGCEIKQLKYELNEFVGVNRIPASVMGSILKRLQPIDWLSCTQVCQKWSEFVKEFGIEKLVISKERERAPFTWFFTGELCPPALIRSDLAFSSLANSFLSNVKHLKITNDTDDPNADRRYERPLLSDFAFINSLSGLEVLEIERIDFGSPNEESDGDDTDNEDDESDQENGEDTAVKEKTQEAKEEEKLTRKVEYTISLPGLRYLSIGSLETEIVLDTPSLSRYRGAHMNRPEMFLHPDRITHLYLNEVEVKCEHVFSKFPNLQYLGLVNVVRFRHIPLACLQQPNLQMISLQPNVDRYYFDYNCSNYKDAYVNALKQKRRLNRDDLKLVFFGMQLDEPDQLDACNAKSGLMKMYVSNRDKLCPSEMRWVKKLNYTHLIDCFSKSDDSEKPGESDKSAKSGRRTRSSKSNESTEPTKPVIPADLCQLFNELEEVKVSGPLVDEDDLLRFLDGLPKLRTFKASNAGLPVLFYEKLAKRFPQISGLSIKENDETELAAIKSLKFVLEFENLYRFATNLTLDSHEVFEQLFAKYKSFEIKFCNENDSRFEIKKPSENSKFELYEDQELRRYFGELSDLLDYLDEL